MSAAHQALYVVKSCDTGAHSRDFRAVQLQTPIRLRSCARCHFTPFKLRRAWTLCRLAPFSRRRRCRAVKLYNSQRERM